MRSHDIVTRSVVGFAMRVDRETQSGVDWRAHVLKRASRLIAIVAVPALLIAAAAPAPFGLAERLPLVALAAAIIVVAGLANDGRRTRSLSAFLIAIVIVVCLGVAARVGLGPGLALGLGSALVLVAIFFGRRAVWWVVATTTLAIVALGAANRAKWLHPADPAVAFDWSKMSVWVRVAAGYVAAGSMAASAVAMVIAHLEESLRERDRLLVAERQAILDNVRLFQAEKNARERLARLQRITASLSSASTPEEVIEAACRTTSEAAEGQSAVLWMLGADGALRLAGSWGTRTTELLDQFRVIPAGANVPAQHVLRTGQPIWVETEDDYRAASPETFAAALDADRFARLPSAGARHPAWGGA